MYKIGMIGCGSISRVHVEGFLAIPERAKITAVCDILPEAMDRVAEKVDGIEKFLDYNELIEKSGVDAVVVLLPHHLHKDCIVKAADHGKHILCEKPLCISLDEAEEITQAVESNNVTLMSAHNQIFSPCIQEAKRRLEAKEVGRVFQIRTCDCFLARLPEWGWRANLATAGGGELIDTGYHPSYLLLHLAPSKPVAVTAMLGRYVQHEVEGEDSANVLVQFEDGSIGFIYTSWAWEWPEGYHQFHVIGEKGQMYGRKNKFAVKRNDEEPVQTEFPERHEFQAEIEHFIECLEEGKTPIQSHVDGIDVLKVILGAYKATKTKGIVEL